MNEEIKTTVERYNHRLEQYGYDIKTLGWGGGRARQLLRFSTIMKISEYLDKPITSILDVGCGFGDMGAFVQGVDDSIHYTGVDINNKLITEGKKQFPNMDLICGDILELNVDKYDLVCSCGVFNHKFIKGGELKFINTMINRFYDLATMGVAVDFMSSYVDFISDGGFHFPENRAYDLAKSVSKKVILRGDYLDYEYCTYILK